MKRILYIPIIYILSALFIDCNNAKSEQEYRDTTTLECGYVSRPNDTEVVMKRRGEIVDTNFFRIIDSIVNLTYIKDYRKVKLSAYGAEGFPESTGNYPTDFSNGVYVWIRSAWVFLPDPPDADSDPMWSTCVVNYKGREYQASEMFCNQIVKYGGIKDSIRYIKYLDTLMLDIKDMSEGKRGILAYISKDFAHLLDNEDYPEFFE